MKILILVPPFNFIDAKDDQTDKEHQKKELEHTAPPKDKLLAPEKPAPCEGGPVIRALK
jgi:hypothetical protein